MVKQSKSSTYQDDPYDVGYGKPPKHTQFPPGQSGNPKGRPKAANHFGDHLAKALRSKVKTRQNGSEREVVSSEALAIRLVGEALQGKTSSQKMVIDLMTTLGLAEPARLPSKDATDSVAQLRERIDQMSERLRPAPDQET